MRSYYLAGADNEDLLQEGMLGLFKAIRDYNPDRDALFMTFASLCVSRHIRSTITRYNRKKMDHSIVMFLLKRQLMIMDPMRILSL